MKDNRYTIAPANTNTAGFATAVTGATFTLTTTSSGDSLAHKVTVLNNSATDHSGKTLAIVGFDADGRDQTETLTAPAASVSVTSAKYWLTLTSITPSATIGADTFNIGWANTFVTKTFPINWRRGNAGLSLDVTGTINYDLQQTFDDIQAKTTAFMIKKMGIKPRHFIDKAKQEVMAMAEKELVEQAQPKQEPYQ